METMPARRPWASTTGRRRTFVPAHQVQGIGTGASGRMVMGLGSRFADKHGNLLPMMGRDYLKREDRGPSLDLTAQSRAHYII